MLLLVVFGVLGLAAWEAPAQQVTVSTPYRALSDSFFERIGTHWGFNWKGIHFSFGGPNMALPPFGGFDPNAGINMGFAVQGNGFDGFFNFSAAQGYRQNFITRAPSLTLTNGYPGFIADTSLSPFVVGFIPVVGGFPTVSYPYNTMTYPVYPTGPAVQPVAPGSPWVQAMQRQMAAPNPAAAPVAVAGDGSAQKLTTTRSSSAGRAVPSVVEARRLHQLEKASRHNQAMVLYERGRTAEEGGKPNVAKIYYQMAAKHAAGKLREQIQERLAALSSPGTP